jgi:hypothetical protein
MRGADLRSVQELMGHKTLTMTLRYAHLSTEHRLAAVRLLDAPPGGRTGTKPAPDTAPPDNAPERVAAELIELQTKSQSEPYWDRTSDPLLKRQLLYRLS